MRAGRDDARVPQPNLYRGRYRRDPQAAGTTPPTRPQVARLAADGTATGRVHRRAGDGHGRARSCRRRLPGERVRRGARGRRAVHQRRGAGRLRPARQPLLGLRDAGRRARHRHHGQARSATATRWRRGHHPRDRRRLRHRHEVLQHLRRQPGLVRGGDGGARRDRDARPAGAAADVGAYLLDRPARLAAAPDDRRRPRGSACTSASNSCRIR